MSKKVLSVVFLFCVTFVYAKEPVAAADFESFLDNLSDIATKKSLNVDYLPSVVTVIDAQTYIDIGVTNVGEALSMLPGFQVQLSPMGYIITTVRGFKNPNAYLSDKMKVFVDGVAINNKSTGSVSFYLDFPMQLVEKIEVLRGPASTTYGEGAFYATINIITKLGKSEHENQVYFGGGSYDYFTTGINVYTGIEGWNFFTDGYYQQNNKAIYFENISSSTPGYTDEAIQDFSVGFKASKGGFDFLTRIKHNVSGNYYSFENRLNPIPEREQEHSSTYFFSQLSYITTFSGYSFQTKASFSHRELNVKANIYEVATTADKFAEVDVDFQDGFYYIENSHEQNYDIESVVTLPKLLSNNILLGIGATYSVVTQDKFYSSIEDVIVENMNAILGHPNYDNFRYKQENESAFWANPTTKLFKDNVNRTDTFVYANDLISLNSDIDMTLGVRVDNYSDFGTMLSKRAGLVYRASEVFIFKLLYGSAFRAPTFVEAYQNGHINFRAGDENILPEETNTYEAETIYSPNFNNKFSLNVYHSKLRNVIDLEEFPNTDPGYQNFKNRNSSGIEFEYNFKTASSHDLYLNASYIDAEYTIPPEEGEVSIDQKMPDISQVMLKGLYIYHPTAKLSFGTAWKYFSETTKTELQWVKNQADEYTSTAKAVHIFDETVTYRFTPNSVIRATVKNLFDADIRQPSYYYYTSAGGNKREGRNYLVNYEHKF